MTARFFDTRIVIEFKLRFASSTTAEWCSFAKRRAPFKRKAERLNLNVEKPEQED
jgi:hypothetical protein